MSDGLALSLFFDLRPLLLERNRRFAFSWPSVDPEIEQALLSGPPRYFIQPPSVDVSSFFFFAAPDLILRASFCF